MLDSLANSGVLLCMIALGYFLKKRGVITQQHRKFFLTIILNVTMPCAIVAGFDMTLQLGALLVPFFLCVGACLLLNTLAIVTTRGKPGESRALMLLMTCGFLVAPFSMPFVQANIPYAFMAMAAFDMSQSLFNMGLNFGTASVLAGKSGTGSRPSLWALLKTMSRSGPLMTYVALFVLSLFKVTLPPIVLNFTGKVGNANLFLSMTFIGLVLDFHLDRDALRQLRHIFIIRYGCAVGISLLCFFVLPIDRAFAQAVTLGLFAPVSNASMAYAEHFGCDVQVYGAASSISFIAGVGVYAGLFMLWA